MKDKENALNELNQIAENLDLHTIHILLGFAKRLQRPTE